MRVIAGAARRTPLTAPRGMNTRPTSDRAKESLFNIIGSRIIGKQFLELFAGSGAIGIEALSRGAAKAVFVDNASEAVESIKSNLSKAKLGNAEICKLDAEDAIEAFACEGRRFDFVFLDPPYESQLLEQTLQHLADADILAAGGFIVAETNAGFSPVLPQPLILEDTRTYGRTRFMFLSKGADG